MNDTSHIQPKKMLLTCIQYCTPRGRVVKTGIPCSSGAGDVGSIPANFDARYLPSFRRWRFEMKLSPCTPATSYDILCSFVYFL